MAWLQQIWLRPSPGRLPLLDGDHHGFATAWSLKRMSRQSRHASTVTVPPEGELNVQFIRSRPVAKEGTRPPGKGTSRNRRSACRIRQNIRKGSRQAKAVRISSGADRGSTKSAVGKGSENGEGCPDSWQTHIVSGRTKEDRRCTKGSMGAGEGGKENRLTVPGSGPGPTVSSEPFAYAAMAGTRTASALAEAVCAVSALCSSTLGWR